VLAVVALVALAAFVAWITVGLWLTCKLVDWLMGG
jgi:hypothetical protein